MNKSHDPQKMFSLIISLIFIIQFYFNFNFFVENKQSTAFGTCKFFRKMQLICLKIHNLFPRDYKKWEINVNTIIFEEAIRI